MVVTSLICEAAFIKIKGAPLSANGQLYPPGALPFFLKAGFTGIIPKGTPIAQLIPFKREDWKLEETTGLKKEGEIEGYNSLSVISGWYKKNRWRKKTYQ